MMTNVYVSCVAVGAGLMCACTSGAGSEQQTLHEVMTADTCSVTTVQSYPATLRGRQDVDIYPQVEGRITAVCVREGQRVARGQTLFVIDRVPYEAALQTALANERAAQAQVGSARLDYDSKRMLNEQKVVSLYEVQRTENVLRAAEAALQQARAEVIKARNDLSYTTVSSPAAGVVGTLPYRVGALVGPSIGQALTTVSDAAEVHAFFAMGEAEMRALVRQYGSMDEALKRLPAVGLLLNDGTPYDEPGRIEAVSGVVQRETGSVQVKAAFANPRGMLWSGCIGNVLIETRTPGAITVPLSAVMEIQDKLFVYRLTDHHRVRMTEIKARRMDDGRRLLVWQGVERGDVIVTSGVGQLKDGSLIPMCKEKEDEP